MGFLIILDPMLKRQRNQMAYTRHDDEVSCFLIHIICTINNDWLQLEENIFADPRMQNQDAMQMRPRNQASNVLSRVEVEQSRWKSAVEEQRRKVMQDHTMLN